MHIALIAHDKKKRELADFVGEHRDIFSKHELVATGTTGKLITEETGLVVKRYQSGPIGGDQQIGALIANGEVDVLFFLRDPLTPHPHEPDVSALLRLCDVHTIPVATNVATARFVLEGLK